MNPLTLYDAPAVCADCGAKAVTQVWVGRMVGRFPGWVGENFCADCAPGRVEAMRTQKEPRP